MRRILLLVWSAVCCAVLAFTVYAYAPGPRSDAGILFAGAMSLLTFPGGLIVSAAIAVVTMFYNGDLPPLLSDVPPAVGFIFVWLAFYGVGYLQWFRLVPWLWRKIRFQRRSEAGRESLEDSEGQA